MAGDELEERERTEMILFMEELVRKQEQNLRRQHCTETEVLTKRMARKRMGVCESE